MGDSIKAYFQQNGPIEARGVVISVMDASFDVLVLKYGVVKRVYVNVGSKYLLSV